MSDLERVLEIVTFLLEESSGIRIGSTTYCPMEITAY